MQHQKARCQISVDSGGTVGTGARLRLPKGKTSEAEHWFQSSIATVEEAAAKMKGEDFRTAMLDNMPGSMTMWPFLIAQKQTARALQIAQAGRARTLMQGLGIHNSAKGTPMSGWRRSKTSCGNKTPSSSLICL